MPTLPATVAASHRPVMPDPPRYDLWPEAMRSAWQLTGALVRCGPGFRGVGWPETPRVRLSAIANCLDRDRVATHLTAAWVWGAAREPRNPLQVSMRAGRRRPTELRPELRVYEMRLTEADTETFGSFAVTTPLRTALDLLHDTESFGLRETVACRILLGSCGGSAAAAQHLAEHRRPFRRLAQSRLRLIGASATPR